MKNRIILAILFLLFKSGFAQTPDVIAQINDSTSYKNEFGLSILPIVYIAGSATPNTNTRLTINYRRFTKKGNAFRVSFSLFPYPDTYDNSSRNEFYQLSDTFLIFRNTTYSYKPKMQLNFGYERTFGTDKLKQSFGLEGSVFYQEKSYTENYTWLGKSSYIPVTSYTTTNIGKVDTLGHSSSFKSYGVGIHLFYNLRIAVGPRWCISVTAGPNFYYSSNYENRIYLKNKAVEKSYFYSYNLFPILLSDLSVCYKF